MYKPPVPSVFLLSAALLGAAQAQSNQPVSPAQFVKTEGVSRAYTASGGGLQGADPLQLALQCNVSMNTVYDSNRDGRNDTLRTYGFAVVPADVYRLRGPSALSTALQKAQLRAQGNAAEFFAGVRTAVSKSLSKGTPQASGISNAQLQIGDVEIETLRESVNTSAEAVLRYGHATGTRLVSFGEQGGVCVVVRYELPLDQRPRDASAPGGSGSSSAGNPAAPSSSGGIPLPPPGSIGDF